MSIGTTSCMACGEPLEPMLERLGSTRCVSCRASSANGSNGTNGHRRVFPHRIRIGDPGLLGQLETALRLADFLVEHETRSTLLVVVPHVHDQEQSRREVRTQLALWRAHNGARAELVE
jgi:hypothetical protein